MADIGARGARNWTEISGVLAREYLRAGRMAGVRHRWKGTSLARPNASRGRSIAA